MKTTESQKEQPRQRLRAVSCYPPDVNHDSETKTIIADMKMSDLPEDADNDRLISAAPELLEALQLVVDTAENGGWPSAALVIAKAAIAKAVGQNAKDQAPEGLPASDCSQLKKEVS